MFKIIIVFCHLILLLSCAEFAQPKKISTGIIGPGNSFLSIGFSLSAPYTDYANFTLGGGFRASYEFMFPSSGLSKFGLKIQAGFQQLNGSDKVIFPSSHSNDIYALGAGFVYQYDYSSRLNPYLAGGLSKLWVETDFNEKHIRISKKETIAFEGESGVKIHLSESIILNLAVSATILPTDNLDNYIKNANKDFYISGIIGLSIPLSWKRDVDKDGLADEDDLCKDAAEDFDGYRDNDGCPDTDNDYDFVADINDECPQLPEDIDGFEDDDGCPEYDNDQDGLYDSFDNCSDIAEDLDGFEDDDGCPDNDNDNDGLADADDLCPYDSEDLDDFNDSDGCPDLDNDMDGIADTKDNCLDKPENYNNYRDKDGCPDRQPIVYVDDNNDVEQNFLASNNSKNDNFDDALKSTIGNFSKGETISIANEETSNKTSEFQKIFIYSDATFNKANNEINRDAYWQLNKIAKLVRKFPDSKWQIEAYTDLVIHTDGKTNTLIQAEAVKNYLIKRGLPPEKLEIVDMENKQITPYKNEKENIKNRRIIIKRVE